jgi:hypothetical protein
LTGLSGGWAALEFGPVHGIGENGRRLTASCCYQRGFHLMKDWNGFDAAC